MIIGNEKVIADSKSARPGDPSNMVNWDALNALPDLYDGQVVQVKFNPPVDDKNSGDFSPVGGGMYMPSTDLMNRIADARGISGLDMTSVQPIYNDVDWNRMILDFKNLPKLVKMLVGYTVVKQGQVLVEDGTMRISSPCTVSYNAWERVNELWSKEEMYSNGYATQSKYPPKYDNRFKRQAAFDAELKFAERKADSKARNVVIRELCGLQTGYTTADLSKGYFTFYKIVRSSWAIKSEHGARLQALARGVGDHSASTALFGPAKEEPVKIEQTPVSDDTADLAAQAAEPTERIITRDFAIRALEQYLAVSLVPDESKPGVQGLIGWLKATPDAEKQDVYWTKTIGWLKTIEDKIPPQMRAE